MIDRIARHDQHGIPRFETLVQQPLGNGFHLATGRAGQKTGKSERNPLEYFTDRKGVLRSFRPLTQSQGAKGAGVQTKSVGVDPRKKDVVQHFNCIFLILQNGFIFQL